MHRMNPTTSRPSIQRMKQILRLLQRRYGPREYQCWGKGVDVLVDTILSQNTSNANSDAGFKRLRRQARRKRLMFWRGGRAN